MTVYAELIVEAMSTGRLLRVPHDGSHALLVSAFSDFPDRIPVHQCDDGTKVSLYTVSDPIGPLYAENVRELLESGTLHKLTREKIAQRMGWGDLGVDGLQADFYCRRQ